MEYSHSALVQASGALAHIPLTDLGAAFETIPDPRRSPHTTYRLSAMLLAATAAFLANHLCVLAIAEWLAGQSAAVQAALGFPDGKTPHQTTFHRLFKALDPVALNTALTRYIDPRPPAEVPQRGSEAVAIDGKSLRGFLAFVSEPGTPTHLLSLFSHEHAQTLAQHTIAPTQNEASAAAPLLAHIYWSGRVLTGDAMFCDRTVCRQVIAAGGDYLVGVKANQPQLLTDVQLVFDPTLTGAIPCVSRTAIQADKGHGRIEVRRVTATAELAGYADWPNLAQVLEIERVWQRKGQTYRAVRYAVTSLPEGTASAARLLQRTRGHWGIENKSHYVRDVTLGEDKSTVHVGHGPHVLAALRNTALNLLRRAGFHQIAARLRYNSTHVAAIFPLLGLPTPNA